MSLDVLENSQMQVQIMIFFIYDIHEKKSFELLEEISDSGPLMNS